MTANLLGLGNAATPMGIEACKAMNDGTGTATDEQCRLVVMNTASHSAAAHHGGRSAGEPGVQNASGHFAGGMAHIRMLGGHGAGAVQALTETEGRPVITDLLIPALLALTACVALWRRENVYDAMTCGAAEGLRLLVNIVPALVVLLTAVHMLRASGALDKLGELPLPHIRGRGHPAGAAAADAGAALQRQRGPGPGGDLMKTYGVDSLIGKTAAVMLGSTETTFYTISVYFGAAGIKRSRYVVPAALGADLMGFVGAAVFTRLLL